MGKAYSPDQREQVKQLLEAGRDEESIEKETQVSDRTIRRWKLELERYGRIGKPPESRTGRHRALGKDVEDALFKHVETKPDMSVDDMLWWLYDKYKIVVGTRTIRRSFERRGTSHKVFKVNPRKKKGATATPQDDNDDDDDEDDDEDATSTQGAYKSPYAPMMRGSAGEQQDSTHAQLARALGGYANQHTPAAANTQHDESVNMDGDLPEDEETIQLQLEQIALQKREVELKLKMRRLQSNNTPGSAKRLNATPSSAKNSANGQLAPPRPPRDSRSKQKIEDSKRKTAERQEKMLRDLERRSRRREHLTAEWVQSKDIWPLRAQGLLADVMHRYACYSYAQNAVGTFEDMYRELYQLVDLSTGDWNPYEHDELLRERMKRKMGQLRAKMVKSGEIVAKGDGFAGWTRAEDFTGQLAGADTGADDTLHDDALLQAQAGAQDTQLRYEAQQLTDPQLTAHQGEAAQHHAGDLMQQMQGPYGDASGAMMHHHAGDGGARPGQYPMMSPYTAMGGQQGMAM